MKQNLIAFALVFLVPLFSVAQNTEQAEPKLTAQQLFAPDRVADIQIKVAKSDWDTIRVQSREFHKSLGKTPAQSPFTYVKADISIDGVEIKNVAIRKKRIFWVSEQRSSFTQDPFLKIRKTRPRSRHRSTNTE